MKKPPLYVTRPQLPPLAEFVAELETIWSSRILTNSGPYHERLEAALCEMLGVPYISLFNNGTVALSTALDALSLSGEVITTPYSFVATSHCIRKSGCVPVFADVDPQTLNLDPAKIESAITAATSAILPVHCYGNPCDVDAIEAIAKRHQLPVVYDAAHAFGVECHCGSVLTHGDLSVLSFHATKVFNTFEGGAIVSRDAAMKSRVDKLRNFGFVDEVTVVETGGNGKMSEINAALGLLQLKYFDQAVELRHRIDTAYRERLAQIEGINAIDVSSQARHNYSYFPVLIEDEFAMSRDSLYQRFREENIYARRYFFPLISSFPMYRELPSAAPSNLPIAEDAARKVLCLPIFPDMTEGQLDSVLQVIEEAG
jgi:dTDP-4-amino-4,6-dideoxygalactose transaminase